MAKISVLGLILFAQLCVLPNSAKILDMAVEVVTDDLRQVSETCITPAPPPQHSGKKRNWSYGDVRIFATCSSKIKKDNQQEDILLIDGKLETFVIDHFDSEEGDYEYTKNSTDQAYFQENELFTHNGRLNARDWIYNYEPIVGAQPVDDTIKYIIFTTFQKDIRNMFEKGREKRSGMYNTIKNYDGQNNFSLTFDFEEEKVFISTKVKLLFQERVKETESGEPLVYRYHTDTFTYGGEHIKDCLFLRALIDECTMVLDRSVLRQDITESKWRDGCEKDTRGFSLFQYLPNVAFLQSCDNDPLYIERLRGSLQIRDNSVRYLRLEDDYIVGDEKYYSKNACLKSEEEVPVLCTQREGPLELGSIRYVSWSDFEKQLEIIKLVLQYRCLKKTGELLFNVDYSDDMTVRARCKGPWFASNLVVLHRNSAGVFVHGTCSEITIDGDNFQCGPYTRKDLKVRLKRVKVDFYKAPLRISDLTDTFDRMNNILLAEKSFFKRKSQLLGMKIDEITFLIALLKKHDKNRVLHLVGQFGGKDNPEEVRYDKNQIIDSLGNANLMKGGVLPVSVAYQGEMSDFIVFHKKSLLRNSLLGKLEKVKKKCLENRKISMRFVTVTFSNGDSIEWTYWCDLEFFHSDGPFEMLAFNDKDALNNARDDLTNVVYIPVSDSFISIGASMKHVFAFAKK